MKKLIIIAVSLLATSFTIFAGNDPGRNNPGDRKEVTSKAPFQSIVLNDDIDLVLTEATDNMIEVKGEEQYVSNVSYYIKKGTLYIENKVGSEKNKAVIYLSVNQLQRIEVNGTSNVSSNGFLNSEKLKVIVNAEAKFDLKNRGHILFETDDEIDLHWVYWKTTQQPVVKLDKPSRN